MTCPSLGRVRLFVTPRAAAHQAPPSMGFSSQEYQSGLPFTSSGDLPDPRIEPVSPTLQADSILLSYQGFQASIVAQLVKNLPATWKT